MTDRREDVVIDERDIVLSLLRENAHPQTLKRIFLKNADFTLNGQGEEETNGIVVSMGIPIDNNHEIVIPSSPTLMLIDNLICKDLKHDWTRLKNQMVLFGHGRWNLESEQWEMQNGTSVKQIVEAWEIYAQETNLPNVEFVVACNTQAYQDYKPELKKTLQGLLDKKVGMKTREKVMRNKIILPTFQHGMIVEPFGRRVTFYGRISKVTDGKSTLVVEIEDGEFSGLDNAVLAQKI